MEFESPTLGMILNILVVIFLIVALVFLYTIYRIASTFLGINTSLWLYIFGIKRNKTGS